MGDAVQTSVSSVVELSEGIWTNTIRDRCKVPNIQMNKAIKTLENKKKIKLVRSVTEKKKKIYMLYDLTPAEIISGGVYYNNQEFDDKFADIIMDFSHKFLENKKKEAEAEHVNSPLLMRQASYVSSAAVLEFIRRCNISKVEMSIKDIEEALWGLYYEGKAEYMEMASQEEGHRKHWRSVSHLVGHTGISQTPCGVCPVMFKCHVGGAISPQNCLYMKNWLDF